MEWIWIFRMHVQGSEGEGTHQRRHNRHLSTHRMETVPWRMDHAQRCHTTYRLIAASSVIIEMNSYWICYETRWGSGVVGWWVGVFCLPERTDGEADNHGWLPSSIRACWNKQETRVNSHPRKRGRSCVWKLTMRSVHRVTAAADRWLSTRRATLPAPRRPRQLPPISPDSMASFA